MERATADSLLETEIGYVQHRRLEEALRAMMKKMGLNGDPLARDCTRIGTMNQELLICQLYVDLPHRLRVGQEPLAKQMCRACILSHQGIPSAQRNGHPVLKDPY